MDAPSLLKSLDVLASKQLTKLVLTYDRSDMPPHFSNAKCGIFWLRTTNLPLHVLVFSHDDVLADYSVDTPRRSLNTWTIMIKAHSDSAMLFTILKKALTANGPKHYNFHDAIFHTKEKNIELAYYMYKDLQISCQLDMEPPKLIEYQLKLGDNGEYLYNSAGAECSTTELFGYNLGEPFPPPLIPDFNLSSKINSPHGFSKDMKKTHELLLVVNRRHVTLERNRMVLTEPPLKVYGVTSARHISFTYSTVDEISDDTLTAHIGIDAVTILLENMVLQIDHWPTEFVLPLEHCDLEGNLTNEIRENFLNPEYKDLLVTLVYTNWYYSDNPILLNEDELVKYTYAGSGYQLEYDRVDLKFMMTDVMLKLGKDELTVKLALRLVERSRREYEEAVERNERIKAIGPLIDFLFPVMQIV